MPRTAYRAPGIGVRSRLFGNPTLPGGVRQEILNQRGNRLAIGWSVGLSAGSFSLEQVIDFAEGAQIEFASDLRELWFELETMNAVSLAETGGVSATTQLAAEVRPLLVEMIRVCADPFG